MVADNLTQGSQAVSKQITPGMKVKVLANPHGAEAPHKPGEEPRLLQPGDIVTVAYVTPTGNGIHYQMDTEDKYREHLNTEDVAPAKAWDLATEKANLTLKVASLTMNRLSPVLFFVSLFSRRNQTMLKKTLIGAGLLVLLATLVFGTSVTSYFSTGLSKAQQVVKDQIPIEFEIDRAKKMVADLVPDIKANMANIAQEKVQIAKLKERIEKTEERLAREKDEMLTLKNDLSDNTTAVSFQYSGKTYGRDQVESDLANRFDRYRLLDGHLSTYKKMLMIRGTSLVAAQKKLSAMLAEKSELEVTLEGLKSRLKMIEVAKTTSQYHFDDSKLGEAKALVEELKSRLDTEERLVNAEGELLNEVDLKGASTSPNAQNITDRVTDYFDPPAAPAEASEVVSNQE